MTKLSSLSGQRLLQLHAACYRGGRPLDRRLIEQRERALLSPFARLSRTGRPNEGRLNPEPADPHRTRFARDRDRIIHAVYFLLLGGKTQVFPVLPGIKPITTTRLFHVQRVAQLARAIGRSLGLNEDLVEAIALGHDLGHLPFGHAGEKGVQLAAQHDLPLLGEPFRHERWALRVVDGLEKLEGRALPGLNLTFEVRDGISRHCGEELNNHLAPSQEYDLNKIALPTTLEGCLVKLIDVVGYAPQDLRDLMQAGYTSWDKVPPRVTITLGATIRGMYDTLVRDIIENSAGRNRVSMSDECFFALKELAAFNMRLIVEHLGETEQKVIRIVDRYYQDRKARGESPLQIIDHLVGLTDQQFYQAALNLPVSNGTVV